MAGPRFTQVQILGLQQKLKDTTTALTKSQNQVAQLSQQLAALRRPQQSASSSSSSTSSTSRQEQPVSPTSLAQLTAAGDFDSVRARIDGFKNDLRSAIIASMVKNDDAFIDYYLRVAATFELPSLGENVLVELAKQGNEAELRAVLDHYPSNDLNLFFAALDEASTRKCKEVVANAILFYAAKQDLDVELKRALKAGADPEAPAIRGISAIDAAKHFSRTGPIEVMEAEIAERKKQRAASTNAAAHFAGKNNNPEIDAFLLRKGQSLAVYFSQNGDFDNLAKISGLLKEKNFTAMQEMFDHHAEALQPKPPSEPTPPSYDALGDDDDYSPTKRGPQ